MSSLLASDLLSSLPFKAVAQCAHFQREGPFSKHLPRARTPGSHIVCLAAIPNPSGRIRFCTAYQPFHALGSIVRQLRVSLRSLAPILGHRTQPPSPQQSWPQPSSHMKGIKPSRAPFHPEEFRVCCIYRWSSIVSARPEILPSRVLSSTQSIACAGCHDLLDTPNVCSLEYKIIIRDRARRPSFNPAPSTSSRKSPSDDQHHHREALPN